jgi:hypothetical protein
MRTIRIGAGAGFSGDRIEPPGAPPTLPCSWPTPMSARARSFDFVMEGALGGGVTRSLALDAHGKCLSSALLDLEIPDDEV